jgi:hypothetical protein
LFASFTAFISCARRIASAQAERALLGVVALISLMLASVSQR